MNKENCTTVIWSVWDNMFLGALLLLSLCREKRIKLTVLVHSIWNSCLASVLHMYVNMYDCLFVLFLL